MADRMVVMHAGIAQQIGAAAELYGNPANLFVAGFIGSPAMNFLDATLRNECDLMIGELRLAQTPVPRQMLKGGPNHGRHSAGAYRRR